MTPSSAADNPGRTLLRGSTGPVAGRTPSVTSRWNGIRPVMHS